MNSADYFKLHDANWWNTSTTFWQIFSFSLEADPGKDGKLCDLHLHAQPKSFFEFSFWDLRNSFRPFFFGDFLGRNGRNSVSGTIRKLFRGSIFLHGWVFFFPQDSQKELSAKSQQQINNAFIRLNTQAGPSPKKKATARTSQDVPSNTLYLSHRSLSKAKSYFEPCWNLKLW